MADSQINVKYPITRSGICHPINIFIKIKTLLFVWHLLNSLDGGYYFSGLLRFKCLYNKKIRCIIQIQILTLEVVTHCSTVHTNLKFKYYLHYFFNDINC